ncbi:hypothetical protein J2TS4_49550 [Paenibacillus sp. J2TS4]|nr:hypothetical protein J2TS4_49550 [Paenibacillus sp. J2TS4]
MPLNHHLQRACLSYRISHHPYGHPLGGRDKYVNSRGKQQEKMVPKKKEPALELSMRKEEKPDPTQNKQLYPFLGKRD